MVQKADGRCLLPFSWNVPLRCSPVLPKLPGLQKAARSESPLSVHFPPHCAKVGAGAATTETGSLMKELLCLFRLWCSGRIYTERMWNRPHSPGTLGPRPFSGAAPSMLFLPPKTRHSHHNIKVTSTVLPPNLTHPLPPLGGLAKHWILQIHLP